MKWYPLAHLAAVTTLCFYAELQALQMLCPTSATGIARAFPSFLLYMHIFQVPDSRYRPQVSLSDNLKPFQRCRGGKHKANLGGLAPRHRQRPPTYRDPFFPLLVPESQWKNLHSIHYSSRCPEKYIYMYSIGDIAMLIVKFRPRWPHTWRYALHSLSRPTMTSGRLG